MDVVCGGEGMAMNVKLSGGAGTSICPPVLALQNNKCTYPLPHCTEMKDGRVFEY